MALTTCPECKKEISDTAKSCPHCGYPIAGEHADDSPQKKTVANESKSMKKIFLTASCIAIVVAIGIILFMVNSSNKQAQYRAEYITNLKDAHSLMLKGGADSESLCNKTKAVWYNTIYEKSDSETDMYTKGTNGRFHDDFNTSIEELYSYPSTKGVIKDIKANQDDVAEIMASLKNPPEDLEDACETAKELYDIYCRFTKLALSPSGNLTTYTQNFSQYDTDFMLQYEKLERLIPEE